MTDRELLQQALDSLEWAERRYSHANLDLFNKPIEAIRTRLAQPEPEPVGFVVYDSESNDIVWTEAGMHLKQNAPLYTAPPKKEWVGLTDDEVVMLAYQSQENECTAIRLAEAKLKEKNNG